VWGYCSNSALLVSEELRVLADGERSGILVREKIQMKLFDGLGIQKTYKYDARRRDYMLVLRIMVKGKGKGHPITGHEGPEGE
jgi:hypothetical protein